MKESIGNAMLFNIIIVFVIILIGFFIGSLDYSKAYKVKNKIIEEIEKEGEAAETVEETASAYNAAAIGEIQNWLKGGASRNGKTFNATGVGYPLNTSGSKNTSSFCKEKEGKLITPTNEYEYCVYLMEDRADKDHVYYYYRVVTFMYLDIPVVSDFAGNILRIPVVGETMTFKKIDD